MAILGKNRVNYLAACVWLLVFSIPFGIGKLVYFSPADHVSEFNSFSLYLTDLFLLICFVMGLVVLSRRSFLKPNNKLFFSFFGVFLVIAGISVLFAFDKNLAFFNFLRISLLAGFALVLAESIRARLVKVSHIMFVLGLSAVFQSIVAILQFFNQSSIGLQFLGEPSFNIFTTGVARTFAGDLFFLRVFGTMPHANILAGFLILGFLALIFTYLKENKVLNKALSGGGIFVVLSALVFTFSRSGWIIALISVIAFLILVLMRDKKKAGETFVVVAASVLFLSLTLGWLIYPRAGFEAGEVSVAHRIAYNQMGLEIIKDNPSGVGIGNFTNHSDFSGLYPQYGFTLLFNKQPVHNLYLLIASELGIHGLLTFLFIAGFLIFETFKMAFMKFSGVSLPAMLLEAKRAGDPNLVMPVILFCSVLLFGFVDHFMWTLQAGGLMLWLSLGMVLGNLNVRIFSPRSLTDKTPASGLPADRPCSVTG